MWCVVGVSVVVWCGVVVQVQDCLMEVSFGCVRAGNGV